MRQGITFNLFKVSSLHAVEEEPETDEADTQTETLEQLRKKALQSSKQSGQRQQSDSKNLVQTQRRKKYVLKRANGICEACDQPAPFKKRNGAPPHHRPSRRSPITTRSGWAPSAQLAIDGFIAGWMVKR